MSVLDRKLLRDLWHILPQALAIAAVLAAGVATFILAVGAYRSLEETRAAYYERHDFADIFSRATRVPMPVLARLAEIPGVKAAEARILELALLDLPSRPEPATGFAISLPDHAPQVLNKLYLRAGRLPEPGNASEVTVNESFATANGFGIGSRFSATLNARKRELVIVGLALSPEYIYAIGPGDLMPDPRRFGILWMSQKALASIFDLEGAFNAVSLAVSPAVDEAAVIEAVDGHLARYGGAGAYGRSDHISHEFLDAELKQLAALSRVIPPIFLLVSAFLLNMTLSRLIALEREQIGLLKAVGYSGLAVAAHYLKMVVMITVVGVLAGAALGTWFGMSLTELYGRFFQFPFLIFRRDPDVYLLAAGVALAAAVGGTTQAVLRVLALPPAVAMQPPSPPRYRRGLLEWTGIGRLLSQMTVISLRNILRRPLRAGTTVLGLALAAALLVVSLFSTDSLEYMIDVTFFQSERQQATINFTDKRPLGVVQAVAAMPGVLRVEPYRSVSVRLRHGPRTRKVALSGKPRERELSRVLDLSLRPVPLPEAGIVINRRVAQILDLERGDKVEVELLEGRRGSVEVVVSDVIESFFGLVVTMDLEALNQLLDEAPVVSGVHLAFDTSRELDLYRAIKATPMASSIALQRTSLQRFRQTIAENIDMMTTIYISLSVIVAFGVVYNSARVALSERGRELASLRVLGFTNGEVSRILLVELAILVLAAQPLGWLLGWLFGWLTIQGFSSDLYTVPMIINRATYAEASLVVIAASLVSALVVRRRIDSLDLIEVLKTRE